MPQPEGLRPHREFMRLILKSVRESCVRGEGGPFGACVAKRGKVLGVGRNMVLRSKNATRHAEICAIELASKKLRTHDLSGCELYSTTEPCVMCFAAIHWARIGRIYFGTSVADAKKLGFNELTISNKTLKRLGRSPVEFHGGFCRRECLRLFAFWKRLPHRQVY